MRKDGRPHVQVHTSRRRVACPAAAVTPPWAAHSASHQIDARKTHGLLTQKAHICFLGRRRQNQSGSEPVGWNLRDYSVQNPPLTGKNLRPWLNLAGDQSPLN